MGFISEDKLDSIGFKSFGKNFRLSDKCSIYSPEKISIGDDVRIDDFCVLSPGSCCGYLTMGSNVHISTYVGIYAGGGIEIGDFCTISSKSTLHSTSDDFSGNYLVGPVVPEKYRNVNKRPIKMDKFSHVGAHSLVMPGVLMAEGSVLGAMSLAKMDLNPWTIYGGVPARRIKDRERNMAELAASLLDNKISGEY